jgi:hypothetical protein
MIASNAVLVQELVLAMLFLKAIQNTLSTLRNVLIAVLVLQLALLRLFLPLNNSVS